MQGRHDWMAHRVFLFASRCRAAKYSSQERPRYLAMSSNAPVNMASASVPYLLSCRLSHRARVSCQLNTAASSRLKDLLVSPFARSAEIRMPQSIVRRQDSSRCRCKQSGCDLKGGSAASMHFLSLNTQPPAPHIKAVHTHAGMTSHKVSRTIHYRLITQTHHRNLLAHRLIGRLFRVASSTSHRARLHASSYEVQFHSTKTAW
jgi:hypothetical protein